MRDVPIERILQLAEDGYLQVKHLEQLGLDAVLEAMQKNRPFIATRGHERIAERLGQAYIERGQYIEAIQAFETGLRKRTVEFYGAVQVERLTHNQDHEEARKVRDYLKARGLDRKQPEERQEEKRNWRGCCYENELEQFYN